MIVESRVNHEYEEGRITPVEEIPLAFQKVVRLASNHTQTLDVRLCYNWVPGEDGGVFVESDSVAADAEKEGFFPPATL